MWEVMITELSVIIPAYNESRYIESCLSSVANECKDYGINVEIIVVDNGSTDNTAAMAKHYTDKVFSIVRSSVSSARNFGVKHSTHPVIAFIDGDVEITTKWAQCLVNNYEKFTDHPLFISGHQCIVPVNGSWIEQYWFKNLKDQLLGGANIVTSKLAFDKIGGFDESLKTGEDYDYCIRSIDADINYQTDENFEAIHLGFPHTVKDFIKREYWHGEGDFKSIKRFLGSPVAIIAVIYLFVHIAIIFSVYLQDYKLTFMLLSSLLLTNFVITFRRFYDYGLNILLVNSILNYLYFCARICSIYRALINQKRLF